MKKTTWVFLYIKYSQFWSISLEHFVERKPLFSEECIAISPTDDISKEFEPKYEISSKGAYRLILENSFFYDMEGDSQVRI